MVVPILIGNPIPKVLVVEQDLELAELIALGLGQAGLQCLRTDCLAIALEMATRHLPQLILLDSDLAESPAGLTFVRFGGERGHIPVILLSARVEQGDKVRWLKLGADDYITKPFSLQALALRARVVIDSLALGNGTNSEIGARRTEGSSRGQAAKRE